MAKTLAIVCSDEPRNGKTLFCRVLADRYSLSGASSFRVFDTDVPSGFLAGYFPESSRIIDLSKTAGQVDLFDTIIGEPSFDYIVDLDSSLLWRFFDIYHDIAFGSAAADVGIDVTVYFFVDRTMSSVEALARLAHRFRHGDVVPVRNEMLGNILAVPRAASLYSQVKKLREIHLPRLSVDALNHIDAPHFTFADFISHNGAETPFELRVELWAFLETVYNQTRFDPEGHS